MLASDPCQSSADTRGGVDGWSQQQSVGARPRRGGLTLAADLAAIQIAWSGCAPCSSQLATTTNPLPVPLTPGSAWPLRRPPQPCLQVNTEQWTPMTSTMQRPAQLV